MDVDWKIFDICRYGISGSHDAMDYRIDIATSSSPYALCAEAGYTEEETAPSDANQTIIGPHGRLPPSPTRSLGGYLDYAGWPEQERFQELDYILRCNANAHPSPTEQGESIYVDHNDEKHRPFVSCSSTSGVEGLPRRHL